MYTYLSVPSSDNVLEIHVATVGAEKSAVLASGGMLHRANAQLFTSAVVTEVQETPQAHLGVHCLPPGDAMVRRLAKRQNWHWCVTPVEDFVWSKYAAVRRRRECLNSLHDHRTDSSNKLVPSEYHIFFCRSRWMPWKRGLLQFVSRVLP